MEFACTPPVLFGNHGDILYEFTTSDVWYIHESNFACFAAPTMKSREEAVSTAAAFRLLLTALLSTGFRCSRIPTFTVSTQQ